MPAVLVLIGLEPKVILDVRRGVTLEIAPPSSIRSLVEVPSDKKSVDDAINAAVAKAQAERRQNSNEAKL